MENIKNIIISFDNATKLKKVVAVKEDKIERYYSKDMSQDDLLVIYSNLVDQLEEQYSEELKGLTDKQKVNKLRDMKLIQRNENNLIIGFTEYEEPVKFVVTYEEGQREFSEDNMETSEYITEYIGNLRDICDTYGIKVTNTDTMIEDLKKLGVYSKEEEKEHNENEGSLLPVVIKENKISNLSVKDKWFLGILGAGTLALITSGIVSSLNSKNKNDEKRNQTTIELATEAPTPTPYTENTQEVPFLILEEPTVEPTLEPTVQPTPYIPPRENEVDESLGCAAPDKMTLVREVNSDYVYDINQSHYNIIELRNQNMDSLENYIQSNIPITDHGYYIYYENLFNDAPKTEKIFVKYFSMFGNHIIRCGYRDINFGDMLTYAKNSCHEVVAYIRDNKPLTVYINGEETNIYYNDLSKRAKEIVLNIAWSNYTVLNSSPELYKLSDYGEEANIAEINYNGEILTKSDIADILITAYEELSMTK